MALNYRPHVAEGGYRDPEVPLVFPKFPSCLGGPYDPVDLPTGRVDWEVELVAVFAREAYRVPAEQGWSALAGLTIGQDLSERALQLTGSPPQFSLAKSHPGFGPTGPYLVSPNELTDPDDLMLSATLDGELVQQDRTSSMIFSVPQLVAFVTGIVRVFPGDLLFTGTPADVGNRRHPPRYLRPGEALVSAIEGLGSMRQAFRAG